MSYDDYITEPPAEPADDTEAAIEEAVEYLDAQTYDARGLHIYHDDATCTYWLSSSEDMATLGRRLIDAPQRCVIYSRWCADTVSVEVDVETIVRDSTRPPTSKRCKPKPVPLTTCLPS